ncbi:cupin domain-containing protein [Leucobacter soli]
MGGIGADERLVTPRSESRFQLLRSSLEPGASGGDALYTVNSAVESVHVVSGVLEVTLHDRRVSLEPDDTLTFPGQTPHTWRAGDTGAEVVWVLVPAAWSGSA